MGTDAAFAVIGDDWNLAVCSEQKSGHEFFSQRTSSKP